MDTVQEFVGTIDDLTASFKTAQIELVYADITRDRMRPTAAIQVFGDLNTFIRVAQGFNSKVAFVETSVLSEDDFLLDDLASDESESEDDDVADFYAAQVDLRTIEPGLSAYTDLVGQAMCHVLTIIYEGRDVTFRVYEPTFAKFNKLVELATSVAVTNASKASEQREASRLAAERRVIKAVQTLRTDTAFMAKARSSRTIRALVAFVRESIDGADDLEVSILTREVTALRDLATM